jgi:hypothetical protein
MLKCCGRLIKPKRFTFRNEHGLVILRTGHCSNPACGALIAEIENVNLFGRAEKTLLRGKKAMQFLKENEHKLVNFKQSRQYKQNTAKGFHYSKSYWDLKKNLVVIEMRELATDRLVKREEKRLRVDDRNGDEKMAA